MTRSTTETSNENRRRIIEAYENGCKAAEIACVLGLKRTTVAGIIRVFIIERRTYKKQRGGARAKKLNEEHKTRIQRWIDQDCSISLRAIKEKCMNEFGVEASERTIARCIDEFIYTFKRVSLVPKEETTMLRFQQEQNTQMNSCEHCPVSLDSG